MAVASNKSRGPACPPRRPRPRHRTSRACPSSARSRSSPAFRDMLLIRRFEEKAGQLYGMGLIGGFCHLYIGQEAVVVGMQMALKPGDEVITGYRDHGHMLACGMDPKGVMAELTGRRGGYSKGKGGSMHMFSVEKGFFGGHGIVGAQVPLGTGLAFANNYRGNDNVSLTYFGDGAANQGQVYESFNMAKLWKLPVIYIIENNQYGMGTSVEARLGARPICPSAAVAHDIPGEQVDGMDVRAVKAAGEKAVNWCRERQRPDHPRDADLPLSRPLDVGPGQVPAQGRGRQGAHRARSDRAGARAAASQEMGDRGRAEEDRRRGARASSTRRPNSPPTMPSPIRPSSTPTSTLVRIADAWLRVCALTIVARSSRDLRWRARELDRSARVVLRADACARSSTEREPHGI